MVSHLAAAIGKPDIFIGKLDGIIGKPGIIADNDYGITRHVDMIISHR